MLSWRGLYPVSRLCYCAYLLHPQLIRNVALHADSSFHMARDHVVSTCQQRTNQAFCYMLPARNDVETTSNRPKSDKRYRYRFGHFLRTGTNISSIGGNVKNDIVDFNPFDIISTWFGFLIVAEIRRCHIFYHRQNTVRTLALADLSSTSN